VNSDVSRCQADVDDEFSENLVDSVQRRDEQSALRRSIPENITTIVDYKFIRRHSLAQGTILFKRTASCQRAVSATQRRHAIRQIK